MLCNCSKANSKNQIKSLKNCEEDVFVSQISKGSNTLVWPLALVKERHLAGPSRLHSAK